MSTTEWTSKLARFAIAGAILCSAVVAGQAQETIRVGAPLPMTGPLAPEGAKQKKGYDLWAEAANAKGGIKANGKTYKVEIVYFDYASNTPRAVQGAERMITEDKVNFLFAPFGSGASKAASSVSERYGIPTIAATASSAEVYDQGYKFLFGTLTPNETVTEPITNIVTSKNKDVKKVAILARNDLFPLAVAQQMEKSLMPRAWRSLLSNATRSAPWIILPRSRRCGRQGLTGSTRRATSTTSSLFESR